MLMRRTPMNPGKGFKPRGIGAGAGPRAGQFEQDEGHHHEPGQADSREARLQERAQRQLESARATAGMVPVNVVMVAGAGTTGISVIKEKAIESEPYRRLVAQLPCLWCGISGYSQHAHLNLGKGLGMKTDDRTGFPLCCSRPGIEGCHAAYDNYRLLESGGREAHREYGLEAGRFTRQQILKAGLWPSSVPRLVESLSHLDDQKNQERALSSAATQQIDIGEVSPVVNEILQEWHRWCSDTRVGVGYGNRSMSCSIGPGVGGVWEVADLEAVDAVIDAIPQPHRTAISFVARNLACRAQVWSSPRLPTKRDELQVLLMEARNMLTRGLIAKGIL